MVSRVNPFGFRPPLKIRKYVEKKRVRKLTGGSKKRMLFFVTSISKASDYDYHSSHVYSEIAKDKVTKRIYKGREFRHVFGEKQRSSTLEVMAHRFPLL